MTISPFTAGTYVSDRNTSNLVALKSRLDGLSTQLATGNAADSYGGLGSARTTSLSAHATLSALDGYDSAIQDATTRVQVASTSLTQLSTLSGTVKSSLGSATSVPAINNATQLARNAFDASLDALNQEVAGQYLFGGRTTDAAPVATSGKILNGDTTAGLAGLKAVIAERKTADGATSPGTGGLVIPAASGSTVTLSETPSVTGDNGKGAANRANFGFVIGSVTSSNTAAISSTATAAVAASADPTFATLPKEGDVVRVTINQADGSQKLVDYTARANPTSGANEFAIGATAAASAANLKSSLGGAPLAAAQSAAPPGVGVAFTGGSAGSVALNVIGSTPPVDGDTVSVRLTLRDGTTTTLTLTARTTPDAGQTSQFQIGATPAATAANLQAALLATVKDGAATTLAASSTVLASQDFFAGSKTTAFAPRRVDATNGGFLANPAASAKTVIWYTGDDTSLDPRATATVQVGATRKLDIGAQANEAPIRTVIAGFAALAAETFTDPTNGSSEATRYGALAARVNSSLATTDGQAGVEGIASDLSLAAKSMDDAKGSNATTRAALQGSLDGVDTISTEEVTVQLLSLQTQLQASYQVTSMLSKLSLVNYL